MAKLDFNSNQNHTLGVELELALVDVETGHLTSAIQPLLDQLPDSVRPWCKPELMQCCVEVITDVCQDITQVKDDLTTKLTAVERVADDQNIGLWWGSTHPFSLWRDQQISPSDRYDDLVNLLQEIC